MLIESASVKVILPEGCTGLELATPFPVSREGDSEHYTYLNTTGSQASRQRTCKLLKVE